MIKKIIKRVKIKKLRKELGAAMTMFWETGDIEYLRKANEISRELALL